MLCNDKLLSEMASFSRFGNIKVNGRGLITYRY